MGQRFQLFQEKGGDQVVRHPANLSFRAKSLAASVEISAQQLTT